MDKYISMYVIGFVGSPRIGGNTTILVEKALEGAKAAGAETELITLTTLSFSGCRGCAHCKSHDTCRLDDDMQKLYVKMKQADRFVFGTPVYFADMTGQFKQFLDRWYALIDKDYQTRLSPGKKAALLIAQGDPDITQFTSIKSTIEFALNFLGVPLQDTIIVGDLADPKDVLKRPEIIQQAEKAGHDLVK